MPAPNFAIQLSDPILLFYSEQNPTSSSIANTPKLGATTRRPGAWWKGSKPGPASVYVQRPVRARRVPNLRLQSVAHSRSFALGPLSA